ncbi:MAG: hypothetical protein CEE41_04365 [Hadesarchaea archaeon B3_Hades]|nr:MAG: hypothetical protein CEE41_04365 [Hadesarchaea archaeon B3_Hades]
MNEKKEKKAHGIQVLLRMVVRDPDGKIISDTGRKPTKSFVFQFLKFIYGMFRASGDYLAKETSGASGIIYDESQDGTHHFRLNAALAQSLYGVVVGTGDTAEDNEDYALATQLTEGVTAGKISHGAMIIGTAGVVGANVDLEVKRAFTNLTGSTITVKEAGVYVSRVGDYFCILRDVLPAAVDVYDKCSLTVYYTFRTTV